MVKDMVLGKSYMVDGKSKILSSKTLVGAGGTGAQDPYYDLTFEGNTEIKLASWDDKYKPVVAAGGKQKSRRNRKSHKSRKGKSIKKSMKSNRRR